MKKISIIVISILLGIVAFGAVGFGVLRSEELKRQAKKDRDRSDMLAHIQETDAKRKAYFEEVRAKKEELRARMGDAKQQYDQLIKDQPAIVSGKKQMTTKVVEQKIPVTSVQTVTKPTSTKTTKTS